MTDVSDSRWIRIKAIVADAIDLAPEARPAWVERECDGDPVVRSEVETLLRAHDQAGAFLEAPLLAMPGVAKCLVEATESSADERPLPDRFGAYRVLRELGRGGMGVVYLGARDDDRFEKLVAIKAVSGDVVHPAVFRRFEDERRILASLDHANIAPLLDAGTTEGGVPYVVMEYVEGESIDSYCGARRLTVHERLDLFLRVCGAVQYSHQHLVVHRDIKARNILVTPDGVPKLLDFGIAKLLEPGGIEGSRTRTAFRVLTPESASPEQVRGEPVTVATDVYSLGVLLYRLLTERSPYRGSMTTDPEIVRAICDEEPLRPSDAAAQGRDLRGDLDLITLKALRKDPARRYPSVELLAQDITRHLDRLPVLAAPDAWTYRARKFVGRHWIGLAAAAAVTFALLLGGAATWWQAQRAERRFNDLRKLANTFMFDVHDAIEKLPGSTAARKLLVTEALAYLDSLAFEAGGDALLQRELAGGYEKMADVLGRTGHPNLGDIKGAVAAYRKAQAARERLRAADPTNRDIQRDLSTTSLKLAQVLFYTGDAGGGVDEARKSSVIEESLAATDKTPPQSLRLGTSYTMDGYLLGAGGRTVESLDRLRKAIALLELLEASDWKREQVQVQLALAYSYLAEILDQGTPVPGLVPDLHASLEYFRKALALDESLARADLSNTVLRRRVSAGLSLLGGVASKLGDQAAAASYYRRALDGAEELARADPANLQGQSDLALACERLGTTLAQNGETEEAFRLLNRAAKLLDPVIAHDSANLNTRAHVADYNVGLGHAHAAVGSNPAIARDVRLGHWREARARFQAGHTFYAEMRDRGLSTGETDVLAREISKCDVALARGR
ncbi:MAG: protein kinase [Solirubrobacterales bacterium]|jgi:tetratricopeptide (TPR) repeat protein/predicted Ser/Thr protein kinase